MTKTTHSVDTEAQHRKYYHGGYREVMLTFIHGVDAVFDVFDIDLDRYSPDSARRISYNHGASDAVRDFIGLNPVDDEDWTIAN